VRTDTHIHPGRGLRGVLDIELPLAGRLLAAPSWPAESVPRSDEPGHELAGTAGARAEAGPGDDAVLDHQPSASLEPSASARTR
jgi:hypothetical protein